VVVFILLGGYSPFQNADRDKQFDNIKNGRYTFEERYWGTVTELAKDLLRQLLCVDPARRLSAAAAREHPWVTADVRALRRSTLDRSIVLLREFNAARKFKSAVNSVLFLNKLSLHAAPGAHDGEESVSVESATGVFNMRQKEHSIY